MFWKIKCSAAMFILGILLLALGTSAFPTCYQYQYRYEKQVYYTKGSTAQVYYRKCGWLGWGRCRAERKIYHTNTYYTNQLRSFVATVCCSAFSGVYPNCKPICNPGCSHGYCTYDMNSGQNLCICDEGWRGDGCEQDINECAENLNLCHQCLNTEGSYECSCEKGFLLAYDGYDGYTCFDINECAIGQHTCLSDVHCKNTIGDYYCECGYGYQNDENDLHVCLDVNECLVANGGCQHTCSNTDGFFECTCETGYEQRILKDFRKCYDINECEMNICEQQCINSAGSYECYCNEGCEPSETSSTSCQDIDECELDEDGCSHNCTNIHCDDGKYICSCTNGYQLQSDNRTCIDINECGISNGGCEHNCTNTEGSYECTCKEGYQLADDRHSCEALSCPTLFSPVYGTMSCTGTDQIVGDECTFACDKHYVLSGSESRQCLPSTTWSGVMTTCSVIECPTLVPSEHSVIVSPCPNYINSTCVVSCERGYYMEGFLLMEQTCEYISEGDVDWTIPPFCLEIQTCDPNPCKHSGICSVSDENIALCTCTSPKYKGRFCETEQIVVSDLPILIRGQVSQPVTITAVPSSDLNIDIITDPSIDILPFRNLVISPPYSSVSFRIRAKDEGIYELEYSISTFINFKEPEKQLVLVTSNSVSSGSYNSNELRPGCCVIMTNLTETGCFSSDQSISLSSSCSRSESSVDIVSPGVSFIQIDDRVLPLSIAGVQLFSNSRTIDTVALGTIACSQCSTNDGACYSNTPTVSDIRDMLQSRALLQMFLQYAARVMPSPVLLQLSQDSNNPKLRFSSYDFHGIVTQASMITDLNGCENIDVQEGLFLVLRVTDDLDYAYFEEYGSYHHNDEQTPLCFVTSICEYDVAIMQASLTDTANIEVLKLTVLKLYLDSSWDIKILSIMLSRFGMQSFASTPFWNGNALFLPSAVLFNINLRTKLQGNFSGDLLSAEVKFDGNIYSTAVQTTSSCDAHKTVRGKMVLTVNTLMQSHPEYVSLESNNGMGIIWNEDSCSNETASTSVSVNLQFSPLHTSSGFTNFLYGSDQCSVEANLKYSSSLAIEQISFHSSCLTVTFQDIQFSGLDTITRFTTSNQTSIMIESAIKVPTSLGYFITLYPQLGPNILFGVFYNQPGIFGYMPSANLQLFDTQVVTSVLIDTQQLSFHAMDVIIFDYYQVDIQGSANTDKPWEALEINVNIRMTDFYEELEEYVVSILQQEAENARKRLVTCQNNQDEVNAKVSALEQKLSQLESMYSDVSLELEQALMKQQEFNKTKTDHEKILDNLLDTVESVCKIKICDKTCEPGYVLSDCFDPGPSVSKNEICTKYEWKMGTQIKSFAIISKRCEYYDSCGGWWSVRCHTNCRASYYMDIEYKEVDIHYRRPVQYPCSSYDIVTSQIRKDCYYESACSILKDDVECISENENCFKERIVVLEAQGGNRSRIEHRYIEYTKAAKILSAINIKILLLQISEVSLAQQINTRMSALESTQAAQEIILKSCDIISEEVKDGTCIQKLIESKGIDNIVRIQSVSSDVTVQTKTPVVLPLDVTYQIPYKQTTHQTTVNVDFTAPVEITKSRVGNSLFDKLVTEYTGSHPVQKRQTDESLFDLFINNCNKLKDVLSYFQLVSDVLQETHENTIAIIFNVTSVTQIAIENSDAVLNTLSEIKSNYSNLLMENEELYQEKRTETLQDITEHLNSSEIAKWQNNMEQIQSSITNIGEIPCHSFSDCLVTSLKVLGTLVQDIPQESVQDIYDSISNMTDTLPSIASNNSLSFSEIEIIVNDTVYLAQAVDDLGYWCSTTPVIKIHPVQSVNISIGSSLYLECEAESSLPITYRWKKDDRTVGKSKSLIIHQTQSSDMGVYRCDVYNAVGVSKSHPSLVTVYQSPYLARQPSPITTFIGALRATIFCDIQGSPYPKYSWFSKYNATAAWKLISGDYNNTLQLKNLQLTDEKWYTCEASNSFGSKVSTPVFLTVLPSTLPEVSYTFDTMLTLTQIHDQKNSITLGISPTTIMFSQPISERELQIGFQNILTKLVRSETVSITILSLRIEKNVTLFFSVKIISNSSLYNIETPAISPLQILESAKIDLESWLKNTSMPMILNYEDRKHTVTPIEITTHPHRFSCPVGYEFDENEFICVSCKPGTFWSGYESQFVRLQPTVFHEVEYPACSPCSVGYYQNHKGIDECQKCPQNYSTLAQGSIRLSDCIELCEPGSYSENRFQPCKPCLKGFYQLNHGGTYCLPCTNTTVNTQCHSVLCEPDHYSSNGLKPCTLCDKGYFQDSIGTTSCKRCENNSTSPLCKSSIRFIQDSPIVFDSNITVILEVTPTVVSYKCEVSHIGTIDCSSGVFAITNLKPETRYDITVTGTDISDETITIERRVIPAFSTQCSVHLINDGITVNGNMIIAEFSAVGTPGALCAFDGSTKPCTSPVVYDEVDPGDHFLLISSKQCSETKAKYIVIETLIIEYQ